MSEFVPKPPCWYVVEAENDGHVLRHNYFCAWERNLVRQAHMAAGEYCPNEYTITKVWRAPDNDSAVKRTVDLMDADYQQFGVTYESVLLAMRLQGFELIYEKGKEMARINFNNVSETTVGGALPNGPYVLKVVSASYSERNSWGDEQTYVEIVFDVAEGPHADALANRPDFAHTARLEFGDGKRLGILKHSLACISRSNANPNGAPFDAEAAFNALIDPDDPRHGVAAKAFEGKLFGGNVVQYHKPKKDGTDGTTEMVWTWYDAQEVREGKDKRGRAIEPLEDKYKRGYTPSQAAEQVAQVPDTFQPGQTPDLYGEDVPF